MSSILSTLLILAVVVLVLVRQFRPQRLTGGGHKWLVMPAVLVAVAFSQPGGFLDADARALSLLLLGAGLVTGLLMAMGWAWSSRIWTEPDGSTWAGATKLSVLFWLGGFVVRLGLMGLGSLMGVHQGSGVLLLTLAVFLLVRRGLLRRRAGSGGVRPFAGERPYGGSVAAAQGKDRV
ncbi:DUF1453 domain-containing protein [Streptomyces sp. NPDC088725]|uniref:DUF1453 domain-containing protein n=1 Tax=Streptomyces sp. NPDC088725 TaxID=3365873 RepID=UPI003804726E